MALHNIFVSPLQPFSVNQARVLFSASPSLTTAVVTVVTEPLPSLHCTVHCAMAGTGFSGAIGAFGSAGGSTGAMSVEGGTSVSQLLTAVGQQLLWIAVEVTNKPDLFPVDTADFLELERIAGTVEEWKSSLEVRRAPPAAFRYIVVSLLHGIVG